MALQEAGLTPKPWDECDSFLQFTLWPGPIDMDMPPGEIWGTEEHAAAFGLVRQLKQDQPPGDVRDVRIRHILGQLHILLVNHYKQLGTDDEDRIRQDPAAWWEYSHSGRHLAKLRNIHLEMAAKLARAVFEHRTVGHAHVRAVTGQRVQVQMSGLILVGE
jgi:hypothetical protein